MKSNYRGFFLCLRVSQIVLLVTTIALVLNGSGVCKYSWESSGHDCSSGKAYPIAKWNENSSKLIGQYAVIGFSSVVLLINIVGVVIKARGIQLIRQYTELILLTVSILLLVACVALEAWFTSGKWAEYTASARGFIMKIKPMFYVQSWLGATVLYFIELVVASVDVYLVAKERQDK